MLFHGCERLEQTFYRYLEYLLNAYSNVKYLLSPEAPISQLVRMV